MMGQLAPSDHQDPRVHRDLVECLDSWAVLVLWVYPEGLDHLGTLETVAIPANQGLLEKQAPSEWSVPPDKQVNRALQGNVDLLDLEDLKVIQEALG